MFNSIREHKTTIAIVTVAAVVIFNTLLQFRLWQNQQSAAMAIESIQQQLSSQQKESVIQFDDLITQMTDLQLLLDQTHTELEEFEHQLNKLDEEQEQLKKKLH